MQELGLQRIEAQHSVALSRNISTPNIASKGKLAPRTARIPISLFPAAHAVRAQAEEKKKNLIVEVEPTPPSQKPKGILKDASASGARLVKSVKSNGVRTTTQPKFQWTKDGQRIKITVHVPELVSSTRDSRGL